MATAELDDIKTPAEGKREPKINVLFRTTMKYEASDLHLKVGLPPMMRLKNAIRQMEMPALNAEQMERLLFPIMSQRSQRLLEMSTATGSQI